jgi:hypothetical protein
MAHDEPSSGFLSRWSRRKTEVREGRVLDEPTPTLTAPVAIEPTATQSPCEAPPQAPVPTLADTAQLTPESDFTGFMTRGVAPDVKNAAMKKLFTDPHFNVMDRLDIYIDDYNQPDPLPLAMLRQMTSAQTLHLFDEAADTADAKTKVVAQSAPIENNSNPEPHTHDHADLRLQPDPAPRSEGAGSEPV